MLTEEELEIIVSWQIDKSRQIVLGLAEGGDSYDGGTAEQAEKLGVVGECGSADCVSGKDILQD